MVRAAGEIGKLLPRLIDRGITDFYAGGALGFDYAASVTVINSKRLYPELTLNLALPCRGHTKNWSEADRLMFGRMAARADSVVYVSDGYAPGCMQRRNRYMVEHSGRIIAVFDGQDGGTKRTVEYAMRQGLEVVLLPPAEG